MVDATISSRAFSSGFDIKTSVGNYSAKKVALSPTGEFHILDSSGNQIARLEFESFFSNIYNVIINGGGFFQFERDGDARRAWTINGEGKLLRISERSRRKFLLSDGSQEIAECSKSRFFCEYQVRVFNEPDLRIVLCAFIALSLREHQPEPMAD